MIAVVIGFAISMALALLVHRYRRFEQPVIAFTSFLYTIPARWRCSSSSWACPDWGSAVPTAEVALVSYTLLILFRNMLTGLRDVPAEVRDAAAGMGMSRRQMLLRVELPWRYRRSSPACGSRPSARVALATLAVLMDNEGLGVPILAGINADVLQDRADCRGRSSDAARDPGDGLLVGAQRVLTPWARARAV